MNGLEAALPHNNVTANKLAFSSSDTPLSVPLQASPLSGILNYTFQTNPPAPGSGSSLIPIATIPHNFGYTPASMLFLFMAFEGTNPSTTLPANAYFTCPSPLSVGSFVFNWINYEVDDQNMVINYQIDSGGGSDYIDVTNMQITLKYYIFSNKLE